MRYGDSNNYANSEIRAWLNNDFYNSAFITAQKALVQNTLVDNSAETTASTSNPYCCENTNDNIFLLSYQDILSEEYGFSTYTSSDSTRVRAVTDYAIANGTYTYNYNGYYTDDYWLRSPSPYDGRYVSYVYNDGYVNNDYDVNNSSYGVVPALWIKL